MKNIKKCPECGGKELILTQHTDGRLLCITCMDCGWIKESDEFKSLAREVEDTLKDFDRKDILKTNKKLV